MAHVCGCGGNCGSGPCPRMKSDETMTVAEELTLCEATGRVAINGVCTIHGGDYCLAQYKKAAKPTPKVTEREITHPKCRLIEGHMGTGEDLALKATLDWLWENRGVATVHVITYDNYVDEDNIGKETFSIYYE